MLMLKRGGALELRDSRGNFYKLTIPAGAIQVGTEFSINEIKELGGQSRVSENQTWAVKIEPSGTEFLKPANLEIKLAQTPDLQQIVPFSFYGQGDNLHLAQAQIDQQVITMPVYHLSGYGVIQSMQFRKDAATHLSQLMVDRLTNVLIEEKIKLRNGEISEIPADFAEKAIDEFYKKVIEPALQNVNSCRQGEAVVDAFWNAERTIALMWSAEAGAAFKQKYQAAFNGVWSQWISQCAKQYGETCINQGLYFDFLQFELLAIRRCAIYNINCESMPFVQELYGWEQRCLNFEVSFKSNLTQKENPGPNLKVDLKLPYQVSPLAWLLPGKPRTFEKEYEVQVPEFASGTDSGLTCQLKKVISKTGIFHLDAVDLFKERADASGKFTIWFDLGLPETQALARCQDDSTPPNSFDLNFPPAGGGSYYAGLFRAIHQPEFDNDYGMYRFTDLTVNFQNSILVKKTIHRYADDIMMDEVFDFEMKHDPK